MIHPIAKSVVAYAAFLAIGSMSIDSLNLDRSMQPTQLANSPKCGCTDNNSCFPCPELIKPKQ